MHREASNSSNSSTETRVGRKTYEEWKDAFMRYDVQHLRKQLDPLVFNYNKRHVEDGDAYERALRDSWREKKDRDVSCS